MHKLKPGTKLSGVSKTAAKKSGQDRLCTAEPFRVRRTFEQYHAHERTREACVEGLFLGGAARAFERR